MGRLDFLPALSSLSLDSCSLLLATMFVSTGMQRIDTKFCILEPSLKLLVRALTRGKCLQSDRPVLWLMRAPMS